MHEGPLKICDTFLSQESRKNYPEDQIELLEKSMRDFIKLAGFGVKLSKQVIELRNLSDYNQFQTMLDKHYVLMKDAMSKYFTTN